MHSTSSMIYLNRDHFSLAKIGHYWAKPQDFQNDFIWSPVETHGGLFILPKSGIENIGVEQQISVTFMTLLPGIALAISACLILLFQDKQLCYEIGYLCYELCAMITQ